MGWINQRDIRNSGAWKGSNREIARTAGRGMDQPERQLEQRGMRRINQRDSWNSGVWDG